MSAGKRSMHKPDVQPPIFAHCLQLEARAEAQQAEIADLKQRLGDATARVRRAG